MTKPSALHIDVPGKVVLTGEYAVLHGAPAVVAPVSRFLHLRPSVSDLKAAVQGLPYMARKVWEILRETYPDLEPDIVPAVDNNEMVMRLNGVMTKLGLGSSAAEAVGVYRWWMQFNKAKLRKLRDRGIHGLPEEWEEVWKLLKRIQNGLGSGLEIPAMWSGGAGSFQLGPKGPSWVTSERIFENGLQIHLIFLNRSQDTRDALAQFREFEKDRKCFDAWLSEARSVAGRASQAWRGGLVDPFLSAVVDYRQVLRNLGSRLEMSLEPPGFDALVARVRSMGGILKTTGAGGGDCAVAFFKRPGPTAAELHTAIAAEGYSLV